MNNVEKSHKRDRQIKPQSSGSIMAGDIKLQGLATQPWLKRYQQCESHFAKWHIFQHHSPDMMLANHLLPTLNEKVHDEQLEILEKS